MTFRLFPRLAAILPSIAIALSLSPTILKGGLPIVPPSDAGMNASILDQIDDVVAEGIRYKRMPGAVVLIGYQGQIVFRKAFGSRQVEPHSLPMTVDTVFDLASLTKPVATATSIMKLIEQGKIELARPVADYVPEFGDNGKASITVEQLLTHTGGLIPDNSLKDYADGKALAFERIHALNTYRDPGSEFVYSDVGFIMLAELVERVTGQDVHSYSQSQLFGPLGMTETGYLPAEPLRDRAATTQQRDDRWMVGEVHDPRAYAMGGIAGHAGLFSTADDLARYAQMMLNSGELDGVRILEPATVELMTRGVAVPGGRRGLGWDMRTGYSSNRGDLMSARAFGHGGFTGTAIWIDPELDLFVIFLSNRVHPDGKGLVNPTAGRIGTIAAAAIIDRPTTGDQPSPHQISQRSPVRTGIDVLHAAGYESLDGQRIGLITNHTGVDHQGVSTVQRLAEAPNVKLTTLFSPEHGFEGRLDVSRIGDSQDPTTGLKIVSLYGATRKPTAEHLQDIDTLVFDIQDIGARFYTYVSTMGNAMEAAAESGKTFVVLDRPNPISGSYVEGPVLDAGQESFVGFHPTTVRHGMTVGELARMIVAERGWKLDLKVIRCEGWNRNQWYDETGLQWINPSPNMRNLTQATLYPGIGLLETTNISVGRGTDTPFELVGAPWIDSRQLAAAFNAAALPGIRAIPVSFQPESSKYSGELCHGLNFLITDRDRFDAVRAGITLACLLKQLHGKDWDTKSLNRLLSDENVTQAILSGRSPDQILPLFDRERVEFLSRRSRYLLY